MRGIHPWRIRIRTHAALVVVILVRMPVVAAPLLRRVMHTLLLLLRVMLLFALRMATRETISVVPLLVLLQSMRVDTLSGCF